MKKGISYCVFAVCLLVLISGCKTSKIDNFMSEIAGIWQFEISYDESSKLNLPWIMIITLYDDGNFDLFVENKGTYTTHGDEIRLSFSYEDRYRYTTLQFNFICTRLSPKHITGELKDGTQRVGSIEAVMINELKLFDVIGTWDFKVTYNAGSEPYRFNLPEEWQFSFNELEEVWLYNKRKQTYDFDGLNLRFPCHYYIDESTGSAKHVMFVGVISDADHMAGYLYNDVGDALILGTFAANRK